MTEVENTKRTSVQTLAEAFEALPDGKKEYLLGFAEGVIASRGPEDDQPQDQEKAGEEIA